MTRRSTRTALALAGALSLAACSGQGVPGPSLTMPTAASHAVFFPIAPGDAHGPAAGRATVDCDACHRDKITDQPSVSFGTYSCTGCHDPATPAIHNDLAQLTALHQNSQAVAAITARTGQPFDTLDASCRACHPQGTRDGVDHATHFPLPHGDAAGTIVARCADCHVARTTPAGYRVMGCATCHPHDLAAGTTAHAKVPDYLPVAAGTLPSDPAGQAASAACVRCHGDGTVPVRVATHGAAANGFQIGANAVHLGAAGGACLACHPALRSDPAKPLAGDFKVTSCVGCHVGAGTANVAHDARPALETFHVTTLVDPLTGTQFPKAVLFPSVVTAAIAAAGGDAAKGLSAACLQCHPQGIGAHPYFPRPHPKAATNDCAQCHVNPASRADLACAACHAVSLPVGPKHLKVPDVVASDTSLAASARCVRCHEYDVIPVRVATGHTKFPIAAGLHSGAAGGTCLACHPALKGQPVPWAADFKQTSCTGCHVAVGAGRAQHDDLNPTAGQITLAALHAGVADYATKVAAQGLSGACRTCHPGGVAGPPVDHGDYFDLSATGKHAYPGARITKCLDCHTSSNRLNPPDFACATCHAADAVPLATGHALVPDFLADPTNPVKCLQCHADGKLPATSAKVTVTVKGHALTAGGFVIGSGAHAGAAGGACLTCHFANRPATTAAPHWDYARDFKQVGCTGCHVAVGAGRAQHDDKNLAAGQVTLSAMHADPATFNATVTAKGLSAACLYCHADGAGGAPASHPQLFPIGVGTAHAGLGCSQCHTGTDRKLLTAFACATCHAALPARAATATVPARKAWSAAHAITGYGITTYLTAATAGGTTTTVQIDMTDPRTCLRCHADSQVNRVTAHPGGDSGFGTSRHRPAGCLTCHSKLRTTATAPALPKPWGADFKEARGAKGPPPTGCFVCHASGSG